MRIALFSFAVLAALYCFATWQYRIAASDDAVQAEADARVHMAAVESTPAAPAGIPAR